MMQYSLTAAQIQNNHPVKPLELHEGSPALSVKAAEDVCEAVQQMYTRWCYRS